MSNLTTASTLTAWLASLPGRPLAWIALGLTAVGLEAVALWFQYVMELQPCVYCIYIRLAVTGIVLAAIVGLVGALRFRPLRWLGAAGWGYSAGYGLILSRDLYRIQNPDPNDMLGGCAYLPNFPDWLPLHEWLPSVFMPTGSCIDETWTWLGFSMAQWTGVAFVLYLVALLAVLGAVLVQRIR